MIADFFLKSSITLNGKDVTVYDFDDARKQEFVDYCVDIVRSGYIEETELERRVVDNGTTRQQELCLLLPTKPHIKSGEFGEIIMYSLLYEEIHSDAQCCPKKWRWKEMPNMPMHGSDVVFLRCDDSEQPSVDDYVSTNEIKTKATKPNSTKSQLQEAAEHANKDVTSRLATSFVLLRNNFNREKNISMVRIVDRFRDPVNTVSFKRFHNAIAVVDRAFTNTHQENFDPSLLDNIGTIGVYFVPVAELKQIYEEVYNKVIIS